MAAVSRFSRWCNGPPEWAASSAGWSGSCALALSDRIQNQDHHGAVVGGDVLERPARPVFVAEQQAFARTRLEQLAVLAAEAHEDETAKARLTPYR